MSNRRIAHSRTVPGLAALVAAVLTACGGGGSSAPPTPAMVSVTGVVATGSAEVGVVVTFIDAKGTTVTSIPTDATGTYTIPPGSYTFPAALIADTPSGTIVSVLAPTSAPADKSVSTANVTTLTTALASLLTNGQPTNTAALRAVKPSDVAAAISVLDASLVNVLAASGVSAALNPVTDPLTANGAGQDAVINAVSIIPGANGPTLVLTPNAAGQTPGSGIVLISATLTTPPAPLPAPPVSSVPPQTANNYLDYIQKALQDCLALGVAQRQTAARCTDVVDPAFRQNGYTTLPEAVPDFASSSLSTGTKVSLPKTLFFTSVNGQNQSIVRIYYTLNDGTQSSFTTHAQQLSAARTLSDGTSVTWDLIGNQQIYDAGVSSRLQRNLALDGAPGDVSFYVSGLVFNFNPDGPNAAAVNSVNITGPGLPAGGVWMRRNVVCNNGSNMALMGTLPASAPKSTAPINSTTAFYKWDYQPIQPGNTVTPGGAGIWAQTPIDVTTIPLYARYTFTPYNAAGTALPSFTKYNLSRPTPAAAAASVAWNALDPAFVAAFLSPTGAQAAAQGSTTVAWSANATATQPPQSVYVGASQSTATSFAETDGSAHVAPTANSIGVAASTAAATGLTVTCPGAFTPLQSVGDSRFVQLRLRDADGMQVVDGSTYTIAATALIGSYIDAAYYHDPHSGWQLVTPSVGQPLSTPLGFSSNEITVTFDGAGNFTATGTGNNDGTQVSGSSTGTVSSATPGTAWLVDGSVLIKANITNGDATHIDIIGKIGSGYTNADVNGKYTSVSFYNDPGNAQSNMVAQGSPMPVPRGIHSEVAVFQADGIGSLTPLSDVNNKDGVATTTTGGTPISYSVASDGSLSLGTGAPMLNLVGSGELVIGTRTIGAPVIITAAVKNGSGMSNASLNGTYAYVSYGFGLQTPQPTAPASGQTAPAPKGFRVAFGSATFDGVGTVTISGTSNQDGVVTTRPISSSNYSLAADGTLTIGAEVVGAVLSERRHRGVRQHVQRPGNWCRRTPITWRPPGGEPPGGRAHMHRL